jgi:hypothetical protein
MTTTRKAHAEAPSDDALAQLTMRYGELVIRFVAADPGLRFTMPREFEEFRDDESRDATAVVRWSRGPIAPPSAAPDLPGDVWDFWRLADGSDRVVFYRGHGRVAYASLHLQAGSRDAAVVHDPAVLGSDLADVGLYPLSEMLASRLLARIDAVDLHASTAHLDGRAFVFVGHSGAGKTTISEIALAAGAAILSDDRTIVGVRDGHPIAWGTPWHGTGRRSSSRTAPIAGLFLLVQSDAERVVPVPAGRAFKELFVRLIHHRFTAAETEAALATVERLAASCPMWELHFRRHPDAFRVAIEATRAEAPSPHGARNLLDRTL